MLGYYMYWRLQGQGYQSFRAGTHHNERSHTCTTNKWSGGLFLYGPQSIKNYFSRHLDQIQIACFPDVVKPGVCGSMWHRSNDDQSMLAYYFLLFLSFGFYLFILVTLDYNYHLCISKCDKLLRYCKLLVWLYLSPPRNIISCYCSYVT